eukprot:721012-Amphidinium_carterae.1
MSVEEPPFLGLFGSYPNLPLENVHEIVRFGCVCAAACFEDGSGQKQALRTPKQWAVMPQHPLLWSERHRADVSKDRSLKHITIPPFLSTGRSKSVLN